MRTRVWLGNLKYEDHVGNLGVGGRKADDTKDRVWGCGTDSAGSERRWRTVVNIVVELRIS